MELSNLAQSLSQRLMRKTQSLCSRWSEQNLIMGEPFPGPFHFAHHPWTREMHDSEAPMNVGQKSAQMGYSTTILNRSLYLIDIRKESVLYLLPTKTPDATDFSATRFDPLLESSPKLRTLFSNVKNVGTKRAGAAILYIRGSNSRASLKSIPVSTIMFDEFDEMQQKNIPLARERTSGQRKGQEWIVSTPTVPGHGITLEFEQSTQEHYFFPCPSCGRQIELIHENLVIPDEKSSLAYLKCLECDAQLTNPSESQDALTARKVEWYKDAEWVVTGKRNLDCRGFYINQLYSCAKAGDPKNLAAAYLASLTNKAKETEYHNSKMGIAHEVEGARLSEDLIISSIGNYEKRVSHIPNRLTTMGVDVGAWLHIEIVSWEFKQAGNDLHEISKANVIWEGKRPTDAGFHALDELMRNYNIHMCVIDANPERASAMAFAKRFWGFVKLCFYGRGVHTLELKSTNDFSVTVDRTQWLDVSLGRFHSHMIALPRNISLEYRKHLQNIVRIYEDDPQGNPIGRYVNTGDDHFAHSRNYSEIAFALAARKTTNKDIR